MAFRATQLALHLGREVLLQPVAHFLLEGELFLAERQIHSSGSFGRQNYRATVGEEDEKESYAISHPSRRHGPCRGGKSVFVMHGKAPNVLEMASMPGVALTDLWRTKTAPASNSGNADAAAGRIVLEPPAEGTILRIVEIPPDSKWRKSADAGKPSPRSAPAARRTTARPMR